MIYPKPYSIYFRGTLNLSSNQEAAGASFPFLSHHEISESHGVGNLEPIFLQGLGFRV